MDKGAEGATGVCPGMIAYIRPLWPGRQAAALYAIIGVNLAVTVALMPVLSRRLGQQGFGFYILSTVVATWLASLSDYGYLHGANRGIAACGNNLGQRRHFLMNAMRVKVTLLALFCVAFAITGRHWFAAAQSSLLPTLALLIALGVGIPWYHVAIGRSGGLAFCEISGRVISLVSSLIFVRRPEDIGAAVWCQVLGAAISSIGQHVLAWRPLKNVGSASMSPQSVLTTMRSDVGMFTFIAISGLFTKASLVLASVSMSPTAFGLLAGAERISRAAESLLWPLGSARGRELCAEIVGSKVTAGRNARDFLIKFFLLGLAIALVQAGTAAFSVPTLLGWQFSAAVMVLVVLSLRAPLLAISYALGLIWMVSHKKDKPFLGIVCVGSLAGLLSIPLAGPYGEVAVAISFIVTELMISLSLAGWIYARGPRMSHRTEQ